MDAVNPDSARARLRWRVRLRRGLFFGLTLLTAFAASALLLDVLQANGLSGIELLGLLLFFGLFAWIAGAFWTAIAGFIIRLVGRDPAGIDVAAVAGRPLRTRTAIVMPIYNEDPARVAAGLEAIWSSLARESGSDAFDLFILSDTRDEADRRAGTGHVAGASSRATRGDNRVFYRRRARPARSARPATSPTSCAAGAPTTSA